MTAPSKMTKVELRNELGREKKAVDRLIKERDRIKKSLTVRENNLHAEVKVGNEIRRQRDKYFERFGAIKDSQLIVKIRAQTHYPSNRDNAKTFVRGLVDLGIWFFDVDEK